VALAPVVAACAAQPVRPRTSLPQPTTATTARRPRQRRPGTDTRPNPGEGAVHLQLGAYIGATRAQFSKKYGIKIKYDNFPDADTQMTKIRSDGKGGGYERHLPARRRSGIGQGRLIMTLDQSLIRTRKTSAPSGPIRATTRPTRTPCPTCGGPPATREPGQDQGRPHQLELPVGHAVQPALSMLDDSRGCSPLAHSD